MNADFWREVETLRPVLLATARQRVGDDAEDVVQEVLITAWRDIAAYDPATGKAGLRKWLTARVIGRCRDWRRSDAARQRGMAALGEHLETLTEADDSYDPVLEGVMARAEREALYDFLARAPLSDDDRTMLALRLNGLTHREIGEKMGYGAELVRKRVSRALRGGWAESLNN